VNYTVELARSTYSEIRRLPAKVVQRIMEAMQGLQEDPRPPGCKKLAGEFVTFRIRVGDYRVIYEIDDAESKVLVSRIRHRKDAYK
jgi:mRNA interferase RelE/StbE